MATAEAQRARHAAGEQARAVDDRVASVDDKITEVIYGAQIIIGQARKLFNLNCSDGGKAKRSSFDSFPNHISTAPCSPFLSLCFPPFAAETDGNL
jgi:hypothetical protein